MAFIKFLSARNQPAPHEKAPLPTEEVLSEPMVQAWLEHYPILSIEYDALCRTLTALLLELKKQSEKGEDVLPFQPILTQTLERAAKLNRLLITTYNYTGLHRGAQISLQAQQKILDQLQNPTPLNKRRVPSTPAALPKKPLWSRMKTTYQHIRHNIQEELNTFRNKTSRGNPRRLFLSRLRRFFLNIKAVLAANPEQLKNFMRGYQPIDLVFGWAMNILSWLFLLPRLLINLYYTAWHVYPHKGLSAAEKTLNWIQRSKLQWNERKWEYANELLWVPGGILTCFFLIGNLSIIGVYLTVALFIWDVLVSSRRAYVELGRLSNVISEHNLYLTSLSNPHEKKIHQQFIDQLLTHQSYERKRHALSIINNSLVTLLTFLALSCVVLPVLVPLIASCCILVLTIVTVVVGNKIADNKPPNSLSTLTPESYERILTQLPTPSSDIPDILPISDYPDEERAEWLAGKSQDTSIDDHSIDQSLENLLTPK